MQRPSEDECNFPLRKGKGQFGQGAGREQRGGGGTEGVGDWGGQH